MIFRGSAWQKRLLLCVAVSLLCFHTGCRQGEVLGEVTGSLTYQGKPVAGAIVIFRNEAKGVHMTTTVDDAGEFRVSMAKGYGLPLGEYQVFVSAPVQDAPIGPAVAPPLAYDLSQIPKKYRSPETSGVLLTVNEGENRLEIAMQPE